MQVREIGEFGLLERIRELVAQRQASHPEGASSRLLLGIGDDAAAWAPHPSVQLLTTDTLLEGVHFRLDLTDWRSLGWKALAVNLSDIAAMGATPTYALVTLGLAGSVAVEEVLQLYEGVLELAGEAGVLIAGGDIIRSPALLISVTLAGEAPMVAGGCPQLLRRSMARPGDLIGVTGTLGAAAAGLQVLRAHPRGEAVAEAPLVAAHLRPRPRLPEGRALAQLGVLAAMDISDGLVGDLEKLCQASGVGAELWTALVPIHPAVRQGFPASCLELALGGGEDYELLFTAPPELMARVKERLETAVTVIGEAKEGPIGVVRCLDERGVPLAVAASGWDHLRGAGAR